MAPLVVFRADGDSTIGGGHVMRCLALASVFAAGGWRIAFAATAETFKSVAALSDASFEKLVISGSATDESKQIAEEWSPENPLLVVDHYGRDIAFEQACRGFVRRIVVIDDLADRKHDADVLVDSGASSDALYRARVPAGCRVLTGPAYAMLHPDFLLAREAALPRRDGRAVARILVTMGQMDPANATALALDAIETSGFTGAVEVVLGQTAPHLAAIRRRAKGKINLHVNASNMPALIATSDLAVGAGGVTSFERACLGLPSILMEIADNQRAVIATLTNSGAAQTVGLLAETSKEKLAEMLKQLLSDADLRKAQAQAGAALVDGRGVKRILLAAAGPELLQDGLAVELRMAERSDEQWLLELQQKPGTREFFANPAVPTAEEHGAWFARQLAARDNLFAVAEAGGKRAGYVRLDRIQSGDAGLKFDVSIAIDPAFQGKGIGVAALAFARKTMPAAIFNARVLPANAASARLFERAGYRYVGDEIYQSAPS